MGKVHPPRRSSTRRPHLLSVLRPGRRWDTTTVPFLICHCWTHGAPHCCPQRWEMAHLVPLRFPAQVVKVKMLRVLGNSAFLRASGGARGPRAARVCARPAEPPGVSRRSGGKDGACQPPGRSGQTVGPAGTAAPPASGAEGTAVRRKAARLNASPRQWGLPPFPGDPLQPEDPAFAWTRI